MLGVRAVLFLMADTIDFDIVRELDCGLGPVYHMFNFYLFRYLASRSDIPATTLSHYVLSLVLMICTVTRIIQYGVGVVGCEKLLS
jgi:hypothetical protein